jgi:hypothetical protein
MAIGRPNWSALRLPSIHFLAAPFCQPAGRAQQAHPQIMMPGLEEDSLARANRTPSLSGSLACGRQCVSKGESRCRCSHAVAC